MQADGNNERERDFQVFIKSGTPGERYWGGKRMVFYTDRNGAPRVKRSERVWERRPETAMLEELQEMLPNCSGSSLEVTVFQNASPCASLSQGYVQLVNKARELDVKLKLHVVFVALYKVRRPSRAWRKSYSVLNLPQEVHRLNVRGLQSLRDLDDVQLRVFGFSDWQRLRQLLGLLPDWQEDEDYTGSVLQRENETTARDLQRLLAENFESDEDEEEEEEDNMQLAESSGEEEEPQPLQPNADLAEGRLDRKAQFVMFWDNGLHGVHWRPGARALYVIDGQEPSDVFANTATDAGHHAEAYLLPDLRRRLLALPSGDIEVTVYQNLSPCGSCCEKYVDLLDFFNNNDEYDNYSSKNDDNNSCKKAGDGSRNKNVKLTIVFARFYNLQRPSCAECNLHPTPSDNDHYRAMSGLRRLHDKGVALHCFQEQDWVALHQHLQVPGPPPVYASTRRKLEDELMAEDAKEIFRFDLVARAGEDQAAGGADDVVVYRRELRTLQDTLLAQNAAMTSEIKRLTLMTSTLALPLVALLVLLLCYFLFGWRPLVVMMILVTQIGMIWAGQPVLLRGERASQLLHVVQICLSLCLVGMLYPMTD